MTPIQSAFAKVAVSAAAIVLVMVRTRNIPREDLAFGRPRWVPTAVLLAIYLAWMLGTDAFVHWRGPWDFRPWLAAPLLASALRVVAVCVLGPTAEELIFRGWLFALLRDRIGVGATIALTSVGWALLHYSYDWTVIAIIVVDGVLLGVARWQSRSIYPPIAMHMLYNLYAIW